MTLAQTIRVVPKKGASRREAHISRERLTTPATKTSTSSGRRSGTRGSGQRANTPRGAAEAGAMTGSRGSAAGRRGTVRMKGDSSDGRGQELEGGQHRLEVEFLAGLEEIVGRDECDDERFAVIDRRIDLDTIGRVVRAEGGDAALPGLAADLDGGRGAGDALEVLHRLFLLDAAECQVHQIQRGDGGIAGGRRAIGIGGQDRHDIGALDAIIKLNAWDQIVFAPHSRILNHETGFGVYIERETGARRGERRGGWFRCKGGGGLCVRLNGPRALCAGHEHDDERGERREGDESLEGASGAATRRVRLAGGSGGIGRA